MSWEKFELEMCQMKLVFNSAKSRYQPTFYVNTSPHRQYHQLTQKFATISRTRHKINKRERNNDTTIEHFSFHYIQHDTKGYQGIPRDRSITASHHGALLFFFLLLLLYIRISFDSIHCHV